MNEKELLKKIDQWLDEGECQKVIDNVLKVPEEKRDYEMLGFLAVAYNNVEEYDKAIEVLMSIKEEGKNDHKWHYRIGYAYLRLEKIEEAIKCFQKSVLIKPDYEYALSELGNSYIQIDDAKKAKECFEKVLKINDKNDYAWYELAYCYIIFSNLEEAKKCMQKALDINPEDEDYIRDMETIVSKIVSAALEKKLECSKEKMPKSDIIPFTERIISFWKWFEENEETMADMIKNMKNYEPDKIPDFISKGTSIISEDINFNVGGDLEFNFSVDGKSYLFYILPIIVSYASKKLKYDWKFFPGMPGTNGESFSFQMNGVNIELKEIMINAMYNEENNVFDLTFYNEELFKLEEEECYNMFFIMMDLCLGETTGEIYIGYVNKAENKEECKISLTSLEKYIKDTLNKNEKKFVDKVYENYSVYHRTPKEEEALRCDVMVGTARYSKIITDYYNGKNNNFDSLLKCGVKAVYLIFKKDEEETMSETSNIRYDIEDAIEEKIFGKADEGNAKGLVLGGALGHNLLYIDLLLFDEAHFMKNIKNIIDEYDYDFYISDFYKDAKIYKL